MEIRGIGWECMYLVPFQPLAPCCSPICSSLLLLLRLLLRSHTPPMGLCHTWRPPACLAFSWLTCDPVHGDTLHAANAVGHHILAPCLVSLSSANGA